MEARRPGRFVTCLFALAAGLPASGQKQVSASDADPVTLSRLTAALRTAARAYPGSHLAPDAVLKEFLTGPHICSAENAVLGVEVINQSASGTQEIRRCSGLLLRCDGFFVLPAAATSLAMAGGSDAARQSFRVTLHPGTPNSMRVPAYPRHYSVDGIDITVLKLQDAHAPAARTLLSDGLKPGDEVKVVWTDWDAAGGRFGAVRQRTARIGVQPTDPKKSGWHFGEIALAETRGDVPSGATVVGPDGMAVGVLSGSAKRRDRFISFAGLDRVTNCVVPAPTTDAEFVALTKSGAEGAGAEPDAAALPDNAPPDGAAKSARPTETLLDIPAGPVRLPMEFQSGQRDMCGESVACVPAFKIDRYKVSNQAYYTFWKSIPIKDRARRDVRSALYPLSWAETELPFPPELDNVPVLGVPLTGAQAYARSRGMRLPTTYEWARAALGPLGETSMPAWVGEYIRDRKSLWNRVAAAHTEYAARLAIDVQQKAAIANFDRTTRGLPPFPVPQLPTTIPFFAPQDMFTAADLWSQANVIAEIERLCAKWKDPLYVLPSGSRAFDESPFGVRDMLLNGNELALYSPEPNQTDGRDTGRPLAVQLQWNVAPGYSITPFSPVLQQFALEIPNAVEEPILARDPFFLLSRRLVASSDLVHPNTREFTPSDSEAFTEMRARIYEAMMLLTPVAQCRIFPVWRDTVVDDHWGEGTVLPNRPVSQAISPTGLFGSAHTWNSASIALPSGPLSNLTKRITIAGPTGEIIASRHGTLRRARSLVEFYTQFTEYLSRQNGTGIRPDEAEFLFRGLYFDEAPYYSAWQGISPFQRREMGRDWAKDPPQHVGAWPALGATLTQPPDIFLIPNGFRCVR